MKKEIEDRILTKYPPCVNNVGVQSKRTFDHDRKSKIEAAKFGYSLAEDAISKLKDRLLKITFYCLATNGLDESGENMDSVIRDIYEEAKAV